MAYVLICLTSAGSLSNLMFSYRVVFLKYPVCLDVGLLWALGSCGSSTGDCGIRCSSRPGWSSVHSPSDSGSQVLGLHVCATVLGFPTLSSPLAALGTDTLSCCQHQHLPLWEQPLQADHSVLWTCICPRAWSLTCDGATCPAVVGCGLHPPCFSMLSQLFAFVGELFTFLATGWSLWLILLQKYFVFLLLLCAGCVQVTPATVNS